jgi:hypothetical protein
MCPLMPNSSEHVVGSYAMYRHMVPANASANAVWSVVTLLVHLISYQLDELWPQVMNTW